MLRFARTAIAVSLMLGWVSTRVRAQSDDRLELLSGLVRDDSAKVRLEALRALAKIPTGRSAELALGVLEKPMDPTLDYALWLTINDLAQPWIAAVKSGDWKPEGREAQLAFALKALKPEQVAQVLSSVLGDKPLARDGAGPWIEAIGSAGSGRYLGRLLVQASEGGFEGAALGRAFRALVEAARLRQALPEAEPKLLEPFLVHAEGAVRSDAVRLAGFWKKDTHVAMLLKAVASASVPAAERALMFESLRQIGNEAVKTGLARLSGEGSEPAVRRGAAVALAALDASRGFAAVTGAARTLLGDAESLEYWRAVLGIKGAAVPLRGALEFQNLPETAARAGIRVAREGGRNDIELVGAFAKAGGLAADAEKLTGELIKELAARAVAEGDPVRGERVFRRADLACTICHAIGGAGGLVGPDMTSIGASAPVDYLVEALLLPNAKIKEGYHAVVVETKDGEEVTGTVARETQQELFLRNATGQEVAVPKTTIARRENGKLSLMPSGLLEPVAEKDRLDLFAFLSRLGKPGPFDASKGGVARRWRLAHVVHTDQQDNNGDWFLKRPLSDKRWVPVYTLVSGGIPRDLLEESIKAQAWSSKLAVVAATEIDQAAAGPVTFKSSVPDAELWVGGRMIGKGGEVRAELPAGRHRVVLKMDPRQSPEMLRLEAVGTAFVLN
jgi:putative heme-binding domain-containing protein